MMSEKETGTEPMHRLNQIKLISIIRIIIIGLLIYSGLYILNHWGREYDSGAEFWAFIPLTIAMYMVVMEFFVITGKKLQPDYIIPVTVIGVIGIIVSWVIWSGYEDKRKLESSGVEIYAVVLEDEKLSVRKGVKDRDIIIKYEVNGMAYKQRVSDVNELFFKGDALRIRVVQNDPNIYEIPELSD